MNDQNLTRIARDAANEISQVIHVSSNNPNKMAEIRASIIKRHFSDYISQELAGANAIIEKQREVLTHVSNPNVPAFKAMMPQSIMDYVDQLRNELSEAKTTLEKQQARQ